MRSLGLLTGMRSKRLPTRSHDGCEDLPMHVAAWSSMTVVVALHVAAVALHGATCTVVLTRRQVAQA